MGRFLGLIYGLIIYVFFLATFTYAIFFISGVIVPKDVDDGILVPLMEALAINIGLFAIFVTQHTIMARPGFKAKWARIMSPTVERSTFVLAATLALALLMWQWRPMPDMVWSVANETGRMVIYGLAIFGWVIMLSSTFLINHFHLFGLQQVLYSFLGKDFPKAVFATPSLYQFCRHPMMLGFIIAFWATPDMTFGHLLFAAGSTAYILMGVYFEERDLVRHLGPVYTAYQSKVPMLFPRPMRRWSPEAESETTG